MMFGLKKKKKRKAATDAPKPAAPPADAKADDYIISRFDANVNDPDVEETYAVGDATVYITKDGRYLVDEPKLSRRAVAAYRRLMSNVHHSFTFRDISREEVVPLLKRTLEDESRSTLDFEVWKQEREAVEYYMVRDVAGHDVLDVLIRDPHIEDILCIEWDKPVAVVHREYPHHTLLDTNITFRTESNMERLIQRISQRYGEPPSETRPMTSFSDESGIRYTFTGNRRITPDSPTMSIRKPSVTTITVCHLLQSGLLSPLAGAYLWACMDLKGFGLVIGAPSAGKTTMINAIFTMANPIWHYYTIEDVLELNLPHRHVSRHQTTMNSSLQATQGKAEGSDSFGVFDLCKLSLRFRPDFVLVGEILGQEADGLFQAAASGSGCMCSFHASNAEHALTRLEAPPISLSKSQTALLTYVLHMSWVLHDNKRQRKLISITEIATGQDAVASAGASCASGSPGADEVPGNSDAKTLNTLFWYDPEQNRVLPDDLDEVIKRSTVLPRMKVMLGVDDIRGDIERRARILERIRDDGITDVPRIHDAINSFYHPE
ncbi:MAG: type II/IV secretion system ATPase subunit [Thaumarchaeota archaeon]|nr:type II/IV secretion system ATPase subunit [Nitrososphaerota archaeon]